MIRDPAVPSRPRPIAAWTPLRPKARLHLNYAQRNASDLWRPDRLMNRDARVRCGDRLLTRAFTIE